MAAVSPSLSCEPRGVRRVLFVCAGDGNRALMAAALLAHHAAPAVEAAWAHGTPPRVHPLTLVILGERGARSEGVTGHAHRGAHAAFDLIVDLGWPGERRLTHPFSTGRWLRWPTPPLVNQAAEPSSLTFRRVRDHLEQQITLWLECPFGAP